MEREERGGSWVKQPKRGGGGPKVEGIAMRSASRRSQDLGPKLGFFLQPISANVENPPSPWERGKMRLLRIIGFAWDEDGRSKIRRLCRNQEKGHLFPGQRESDYISPLFHKRYTLL